LNQFSSESFFPSPIKRSTNCRLCRSWGRSSLACYRRDPKFNPTTVHNGFVVDRRQWAKFSL